MRVILQIFHCACICAKWPYFHFRSKTWCHHRDPRPRFPMKHRFWVCGHKWGSYCVFLTVHAQNSHISTSWCQHNSAMTRQTLSISLHNNMLSLIGLYWMGISTIWLNTNICQNFTKKTNASYLVIQSALCFRPTLIKTRSPAVAEGPRCQLKSCKILHKCSTDCTWKGLQQGNDLQSHSRSLTLVSFDRPHTISY